jgi:hypothetical protein
MEPHHSFYNFVILDNIIVLTIKAKYKKLSNLTLTEMKQKHNQTQNFILKFKK